MDSKKFEILMTAVNLGSFSKAAEVVGYTQSGLTHLMNGLEREIGMKLIQRDHSGVTLTEAGQALLPAIREYLSATAKLENQIAAIAQKKPETIRVAAYASLAMHWMPEILYRFRRVCPDIDVDLRMVDHELEPFELLEEGRTDVIFAARQSHINCDWTPLYSDAMYAILPEDYPIGDRKTFPIEEFDGKEFLMPYGRFDIDVNAALSPKGVKPIIRPCYVDDETVIRMVSKGLGITMMTEIMMRGRTHGVKTLPVSPQAGRELGMGMHLQKNTPAEILRLRDCVLEYELDAEVLHLEETPELVENVWDPKEKGQQGQAETIYDPEAGVTATLRDISNVGANLIIRREDDDDGAEVIYGEAYILQRQVDGEWQDAETVPDNYGFPMVGYNVPGGEEASIYYNWEWLYGALEPGEYRMVWDVSRKDSGSASAQTYREHIRFRL